MILWFILIVWHYNNVILYWDILITIKKLKLYQNSSIPQDREINTLQKY